MSALNAFVSMQEMKRGWLRVEIATVQVSSPEARDLRERDVVLVDPHLLRTDLGMSGPAVLVLSSGLRFNVSLSLENSSWVARVEEGPSLPIAGEFLSINVVHQLLDPRELPELRPGATLLLHATSDDPLSISWRDERLGSGVITDIDGELGVRVIQLG